ncbi:uncharacterized protein LOC113236226 [Hyposmocoma kahamanoa]|uniref:uncharacterized protein LOC113236226 n=1 Tax=Hyposmocoma kahamanoa TaxID=1477025 RepID=UPI000E6D84E1|nr:uncharacterized protein LOC113236226 [Hyposmocoma kahamanoa]
MNLNEYKKLSHTYKTSWSCVICCSSRRKGGDNSNTPVRSTRAGDSQDAERHSERQDSNITIRNKGNVVTPVSSSEGSRSNETEEDTKQCKLIDAISERELRKSVEFISEAHDDFKLTIDTLDKDNTQLKGANQLLQSTVHGLEDRLNNLEQYLRENNLELHGVPEFLSENLTNVLQQCSKFIGHQLNDGDIVGCVRVAKLNKDSKFPKTIVAKFRSVRCRDEFYSAVYRYNKAHPNDKLNTNHLGIAGEKKPVYVSEHLSLFFKSIHAASRKKAKEAGYKFVWVRNGRIYVRKDSDSSYIYIKNQDSLELIR